MEIIKLKSDSTYQETQKLRASVDCLIFDKKKLTTTKDSFMVDDENFDIRRQPLRLAVMSLHDLDSTWHILTDRFRRNTMIIAPDDEVRDNPEIVQFLESQGVSLLMTKRLDNGQLSYAGLIKSLTSLRFKSLLVEDKIDMIDELNH